MRYRGQPYLLPHLIDVAAERDPEHVAMRCRQDSLTYGSLYERSVSLAATLSGLGVQKGDRVGILMNKSVEIAVSIYGVMAAGAVYVPLDPTAPTSRIAYMIKDCGIRVLISEPRKAKTLEALANEEVDLRAVIGVGEDGPFPTLDWMDLEGSVSSPATGVTELDLSYILYTSGSTGVPKGIMHTHRSALSWANVTADTYGIDSSDVISNYAPLHFDLSTLDFFGGARGQATTVMIPEEHMKLSASLAGVIESARLTLLYTVPMALVQLATPGVIEGRDFSSLRRILFGGEPMPLKHLRNLMQALPRTRFYNVYGPTEVNGCTHHEVTTLPDVEGDPLPIGKPYANVEALVIDEDEQPVGDGEIGELAIRAPTMMRGYWGRPDLNEGAFHYRQRFAGRPEVFHKTGDLVHRDAGGAFHFHGRKDRQVKARGYRVELDEIEAVLVTHALVNEAAVFAFTAEDNATTIGASVIPFEGDGITAEELRAFLTTSLPAYAVPQRISIRDDFPRTTSGKIDRRELALQEQQSKASASTR